MTTRYVVLQFDDGDRFDFEPPLPHPADVFLSRFPEDKWLNADIGATRAIEIGDFTAPEEALMFYPPQS